MALKKLNVRFFTSDMAILCYLAFTTFIGHILVSGNYGYFLDELYTIVGPALLISWVRKQDFRKLLAVN